MAALNQLYNPIEIIRMKVFIPITACRDSCMISIRMAKSEA